ncbi:GTPase HflX [Candidatus Caldatribacterium sp.]|uniref:GTPase HflX n=1 Tax=Candidatus Caldatribacterium sp. TaxID=2282143 RepID=UPI0029972297|nr:GTPase HflX [Candidatus Caldatribacterium sp.]MDW8080741.1 GTPase HflX [Candidatus Calescibacterium sp.]
MSGGLLLFVEQPSASGSQEVLLREMLGIAQSAGRSIAFVVSCKVKHPFPRYYFGKGKVAEIGALIAERSLSFVLTNVEVTPSQQRNLEKIWNVPVYTKYAVIHEIFAQRARTAQGKIKVELARLRYELSRLPGKGVEFSRTGGGIGTRGPGEQKIEVERRKIKSRIAHLLKELRHLERQSKIQKVCREKSGVFEIAIVGYTNAGKSTLLNALTGAEAYVANRMFATLDPLARKSFVPGVGEVVFVDTVGFIREMPETIKDAFRSTLEEVKDADLILAVLDVSDPDYVNHFQVMTETLEEIGAKECPRILVLNKVDLLGEPPFLEHSMREQPHVFVSAYKKIGLEDLLREIARVLQPKLAEIHLEVPPERLALVQRRIYPHGYIRSFRALEDGTLVLDCVVQRDSVAKLYALLAS